MLGIDLKRMSDSRDFRLLFYKGADVNKQPKYTRNALYGSNTCQSNVFQSHSLAIFPFPCFSALMQTNVVLQRPSIRQHRS
jgi:hypothetical protein